MGFNLYYSLGSTHSFQLPGKWKGSVSLRYYGPSVAGVYYNHGRFTSNLGWSRKVLKDRGSISLSMQVIFRSMRFRTSYCYNGTELQTVFYSDTQRIGISFSYSFGNTKVKRAQHNRTNYKEQSRMNSRTN